MTIIHNAVRNGDKERMISVLETDPSSINQKEVGQSRAQKWLSYLYDNVISYCTCLIGDYLLILNVLRDTQCIVLHNAVYTMMVKYK